MAKGTITTEELFGQDKLTISTEELFGGKPDILTSEQLFQVTPEISALPSNYEIKPRPIKPSPIGTTYTEKDGTWKKGLDPFTAFGAFEARHPLAIPMGIAAPVFTGVSLALSKLPRFSQTKLGQKFLSLFPEEKTYEPSDIGFVGRISLQEMRGEPTEITRRPREEMSYIMDAIQYLSEFLVAGKAETAASQKLLENSINILGGKLTDSGYGTAKVEIPKEKILQIGKYTPSGEAILFNLKARQIKIPPRPPTTFGGPETIEKVIQPFGLAKPPVEPISEPISTEKMFAQTHPEILTVSDEDKIAFNKSVDEYMAGETGRGNLYSIIKSEGGIAPYSKTTAGGLKEEYREDVPVHLRSKSGLQLDEMASVLSERYPYLEISSEADLLDALGNEKMRRMQPVAGGMPYEVPAIINKYKEQGVNITGVELIGKTQQPTQVKDIHGQDIILPENETYFAYKLSNGKVWIHDGKDAVIDKANWDKAQQANKPSEPTSELQSLYRQVQGKLSQPQGEGVVIPKEFEGKNPQIIEHKGIKFLTTDNVLGGGNYKDIRVWDGEQFSFMESKKGFGKFSSKDLDRISENAQSKLSQPQGKGK